MIIVLDTSQDKTNETRDELDERFIIDTLQNLNTQFIGLLFSSIKFNEIYKISFVSRF